MIGILAGVIRFFFSVCGLGGLGLGDSLRSLNIDSLALLSAADIEPTERAERLSIQDFCRLAQALERMI